MSLRRKTRITIWIGILGLAVPFLYGLFWAYRGTGLDAIVAIYGTFLSVGLAVLWGGLMLTMRSPDSLSAAATFAGGAWASLVVAVLVAAIGSNLLAAAVAYLVAATGALVVQRIVDGRNPAALVQ